MNFKKGELWTDEDEICGNCSNLRLCPLAEALNQGVVLMATDGFLRTQCGLYQEKPAFRLV